MDAAGILRVGPESAGAEPGPACYGRGGTAATVTDANVVLGHLDPDSFFGGRMRLDRSAAEAAVDRLAGELGVDRMAAAKGIYRLVNSHMAEGIRLVTVRRGVDPSGFALLSFGGAAGAHVVAIARQLGLRRVVVPRLAPVLSAWGMLATSLRHELVRTHVGDARGLTPAGLRTLFADMEAEGRSHLDFDGRIEIQRRADMRYGEQIFEIDVPLDGIDFDRDDLVAQVTECFHRRHEELFTYALREQEAVLVNARMSVIGHLSVPPAEPQLPPRPFARPRRRQTIFGQPSRDAAVYRLDDMASGQEIDGPALIETETTTVLVGAGDRATVTATSWIDIAVG